MTLISQIVGHLSATPTWLMLSQLLQFLDDLLIIYFLRLITIGAAVQVHRPTGLSLAQPTLTHHIFC